MSSSNPARPTLRLDRISATCVAALVVLPVVLLLINHSWVFTSVGWLDPWVYSGYHMHLATLWRDFPHAYYGARLPWTVIGWIVFRIAGVEAYLYILALLLFYVSIFSLFYTIRLLFDSPIAGFVAACLLATNSWFLWSIGWHYIDGPIIAFILLSFSALTGVACGHRWNAASVLWGAAVAATIALFSPNIVLLPVFAGVFLAINHLGLRRPIARVAFLWLAGFVGAILFMCLANWFLGGWFLFFLPQFQAAIGLLSLRSAMPALHVWIWTAPWLLFPAFAFFASVFLIAVRGSSVLSRLRRGETETALRNEGMLLTLAAACLMTTAGFVCMEVMQLGMLLYFYHANELWPFAFLVFGGCLGVAMSRMPKNTTAPLAVVALILCLAPLVLASLGWIKVPLPVNAVNEPRLFSGELVEPLWVAGGAALLVGVVCVRNLLFPAAMITFMSLVSVFTITNYSSLTLPDKGSSRDLALAVYDIAGFIDQTQSPSGPLPIWWDPTDRNKALFTSLTEMMYLRYDSPYKPPNIAPGDRVIFLSSDRAFPKTAEGLLHSRYTDVVPIAQRYVERGSVHIDATIADLTPARSIAARAAIPLSEINPQPPPGSMNDHIVTAPQPWGYAAQEQIPQAVKRHHPGNAYVKVRLRVDKGVLGIGVTLPDGNTFIDRKFYQSSPEIHDVYLTIPALKDAKQIVVTNGGDPSSSEGDIYSTEILYDGR